MNEVYFVERSPDYLEHFGILGQKWGIRRFQNPDGSLTPEGRERYNRQIKEKIDKINKITKDKYTIDNDSIGKIFNIAGANQYKLENAKIVANEYSNTLSKLYDRSGDILKDFNDEKKTYYEAVTELAENCLYNGKDPSEATLEDIGSAGFMGCIDDGQQQAINANSYYIFEKGQTEEAKNISKEYNDKWKWAHEEAKKEIESALKEVNVDVPISEKNPNYTLSKKLSESVIDNAEQKLKSSFKVIWDHKTNNFYRVLDGAHEYTEKELKAIDDAKKVIDNVEGNKDYNTWWYFNAAANDLGLDNKKASEMTQADWDKLNAEIRKLREMYHSDDYLEHHGILGQKWGIRRFQNPDGSLTEEGRKRYGDILTPDQMKNMIKSYNLRTGKNKKINKNTTFKTSHGTYDYKGKRIDTDTNIEDPGNKEKPEYNTKKKPSEMTDEELEYATARQKAERMYKEEYAKNNPTPPEKVSYAKQFMNNLRDDMVDTIPRSIAAGVGGYITKSLTNLANDGSGKKSGDNKNSEGQDNNQQTSKPQNQSNQKKNQNKQQKPQEPKEEPKAGPVTSDKEMDKDKKNVEVNLFGDKDAKLGYKVGRLQDKIVEGMNDVQADFNRSKDKGANYTMDRRKKMASVAMESFKSSYAKDNPELHKQAMAAVDRALTQTIKNASGSEYNKQETFNRIVQDAYYDQMAAFMMQDTDMRARRVF